MTYSDVISKRLQDLIDRRGITAIDALIKALLEAEETIIAEDGE